MSYSLKFFNSISIHNNEIYSISIFPSGNIISVSSDKSIKIYNTNYIDIQKINNAHDDDITYVSVKDENNFITCSKDKNIKIWIKNNNNKYILSQTISNAHNDIIIKVIYFIDEKIISCSWDETMKIWEKDNNNIFQSIINFKHFDWVISILLLEEKNILISTGRNGTKFFNCLNNENIFNINEACCNTNNGLQKIDNDRIIVGGGFDGIIKIISISGKQIQKEIDNAFECDGICVIEDKKIFIIGGWSYDIKIYNSNNYICLQIIKKAHSHYINGIIELKNKNIVSYGYDKIIKIWKFNLE